jgi:hypothetical protein
MGEDKEEDDDDGDEEMEDLTEENKQGSEEDSEDDVEEQYEDNISDEIKRSIVIYEDKSTSQCSVCMEGEKEYVLVPCGHYHTCEECTIKIDSCPICRSDIDSKINIELFD